MQTELCLENPSQSNSPVSEGSQNHHEKPPPPEGTENLGAVRVCRWCKKEYYPSKQIKHFCSKSCSAKYQSSFRNKSPAERLWPRLKIADNGCWEWQGGTDKDGYGSLAANEYGKREQRTHRVAWILTFGKIPDGKWVLHKCDNPSCCNPSHLFLGDAASNNADMLTKGRQKYMFGALCTNAKLKEHQVLEIRRLHAEGMIQRKIAKQFGVGFKAICKIVNRQRWKHIWIVNVSFLSA